MRKRSTNSTSCWDSEAPPLQEDFPSTSSFAPSKAGKTDASQHHLDGPKVLGTSTTSIKRPCLCLPFVGEGWGKQYIKLEALSSISDAITVIQQAFHAANRTPHHSPPDVPLSYKLAKKAIRLDKLTRYEQYLEVTTLRTRHSECRVDISS